MSTVKPHHTVTSVIRSLRCYGHFFRSPSKTAIHFLKKKKEEDRPPLLLPLPPLNTTKMFDPLVNVLTGFHCIFFEETSIILILNNFFSFFQCLQAVRENRNQAETKRKPKRKSLAYDLAIEWFKNFSKKRGSYAKFFLKATTSMPFQKGSIHYVQKRNG